MTINMANMEKIISAISFLNDNISNIYRRLDDIDEKVFHVDKNNSDIVVERALLHRKNAATYENFEFIEKRIVSLEKKIKRLFT